MKCRAIGMLILGCSILRAGWVPEDALMDLEPTTFEVLNEIGFKKLKEKVADTLVGSWCAREKSDLLMDLICLTRPEICVEIGAFTGSSVLPVAAALKYLNHGKVFAIDAWSNAEAIKNLADNDPNRPWWATVDMLHAYSAFNHLMQTWALTAVCIPIQAASERAVDQIREIDFLHLDGDYSEEGSLRDIRLYLPKVKSGGYILLSNLFIMVNNQQPKLKAFCSLFDVCELICEIERDNTVLFRKL